MGERKIVSKTIRLLTTKTRKNNIVARETVDTTKWIEPSRSKKIKPNAKKIDTNVINKIEQIPSRQNEIGRN